MKKSLAISLRLTLLATAITGIVLFCNGQGTSPATGAKGASLTKHATGSFEVKVNPQSDSGFDDPKLSRVLIEKQFHGDLEGTSKVQMLGAGTDVKGSAGYVAIEKVTGKLNGRSGTFVLQHTGTMDHGQLQLSVTVVPDSGTGELAGITGKMAITMADGKHSYDFEYILPETR